MKLIIPQIEEYGDIVLMTDTGLECEFKINADSHYKVCDYGVGNEHQLISYFVEVKLEWCSEDISEEEIKNLEEQLKEEIIYQIKRV